MPDTLTTITLRGRKIALKQPSGIQIAAWQRAADKFGEFGARENTELTEAEQEEYRGLLDKLLRISVSLFADQKDKGWFEDQALEGNVTDQDVLDVFEKAMEGLRTNAAKTPAKKAARRR